MMPCGGDAVLRVFLKLLFILLLLAPALTAGEEEADAGEAATTAESGRDWTLKGPIPPARVPSERTDRNRARVEVGRVESLIGEVKVLRSSGQEEQEAILLKAGEKIFVGDQFEVGKASAVELVMGVNARLRLGSDSVMRILQKVERNGSNDEVTTQRDMELTRGSARVRVRKNLKTPSPILVVSGSLALTVDRSDAVVNRKSDLSSVVVLRGEAAVIMKKRGNRGWDSDRPVPVRRREVLDVPDRIGEDRPRPRRMSEDEFLKARKKIEFTIDREREALPPAPKPDPEMDGP